MSTNCKCAQSLQNNRSKGYLSLDLSFSANGRYWSAIGVGSNLKTISVFLLSHSLQSVLLLTILFSCFCLSTVKALASASCPCRETPPSIIIFCPVMKEASSLQKKLIALARSSEVPILFNGV